MDQAGESCSCEIVQVAITNKDTLNDKMREHAVLTIVSGVCTLLITQGIPWGMKKAHDWKKERKARKAAEQKKN